MQCIYPARYAGCHTIAIKSPFYAVQGAACTTTKFSTSLQTLLLQAVQQKDAEQISIHDLSERVVPAGFHNRNDHKPDNYGDSLHIGNLFDRTFIRAAWDARRFDPVHVNLDPFPLPSEIKQPPQHRLQAVTLVYCDGSRAPMTVGIKLEWDGTYTQLSTGIKEQCRISDDQQITLVLLNRNVYVK